jgi:hypothetical protein
MCNAQTLYATGFAPVMTIFLPFYFGAAFVSSQLQRGGLLDRMPVVFKYLLFIILIDI